LAVCQVRYSPELKVANPLAVAPFQEAISDLFPVLSPSQNVSIHVEGEIGGAQTSSQVSVGSFAQVAWRFSDNDDNWTLTLTPDSLTLESRTYERFPSYLARLESVLRALAKYVRPSIGTRIGLRYINEIRQDEVDWASVIRPELLGPLALPQFAHTAQQAIQQILLRGEEGVVININHGLLTGNVVNPRPAAQPETGPFYLLDIDVFRDFKPGELLVRAAPVRRHVEGFHSLISQVFRWAITETYAETLGRRDDVD